jgi:hypothetical protein
VDFGSLVNVFGVTGALLASAVIAFYAEGVVAGPTHRRALKNQQDDHIRELAEQKLHYEARLLEKDRIVSEKTEEGKEWRDLYRRVLSNLERNTVVSESAVAVARKAVGAEPDGPSV